MRRRHRHQSTCDAPSVRLTREQVLPVANREIRGLTLVDINPTGQRSEESRGRCARIVRGRDFQSPSSALPWMPDELAPREAPRLSRIMAGIDLRAHNNRGQCGVPPTAVPGPTNQRKDGLGDRNAGCGPTSLTGGLGFRVIRPISGPRHPYDRLCDARVFHTEQRRAGAHLTSIDYAPGRWRGDERSGTMWNSAGKSVWLASLIAVGAVSAAPSAWATDGVRREAMQTEIVEVLPDLDTSPTPRAMRRVVAAAALQGRRVADNGQSTAPRPCAPAGCDGFPVIVGIRF